MLFIDVNFFSNANPCKKYLICQKKINSDYFNQIK